MGTIQRYKKNLLKLPYQVTSDISTIITKDKYETVNFMENKLFQMSYNKNWELNETVLSDTWNNVLKQSYYQSNQYLSTENNNDWLLDLEINKFVLLKVKRTKDGRVVMPLLWRSEVSHMMVSNLGI